MDMKGKRCLDCNVELEVIRTASFHSGKGYHCSECGHLYSESEFTRLFKDYNQMYDDKQEGLSRLFDDDDPEKLDLAKVSKEAVSMATNSQSVLSPELQKMLLEEPKKEDYLKSFEKPIREID